MSEQKAHDDKALVQAVLATVEGLTTRPASARVPGTSPSDINRWRNGLYGMSEPKRYKMRRYLERFEREPIPLSPPHTLDGGEGGARPLS